MCVCVLCFACLSRFLSIYLNYLWEYPNVHETKPKNPGPVNFRDSDLHLLLGTLSAFSPQRPRICQMVCSFSVITACLSKQSEVLFLLWLMKIWLFLIVNRYWKSRKESWLRIDRTDMALSYTHTEWISSGARCERRMPSSMPYAPLCSPFIRMWNTIEIHKCDSQAMAHIFWEKS